MSDSLNRRTLLRSTGAIAAAGLLAGCSGDGGDATESATDDEMTESATEEEMTESATESGGSSMEAGDEVANYLGETSNFDGTVADMTGQDTVTVTVGAEANGGAFGYDPAAVQISSGTTVEFEWTGNGGTHNVKSEGDGPLDSGGAVNTEGVEYEHTFESSGTYLYYCTPHKSLGMKGAIVVE
ncbi:halocyanin domain-containing protein [Halomicrobium sp. IBSBa]|uniref:halocyanin domain-containing protein n=1 Tax=Halomicrobium sp. IBSBa TaxID=2778916 RepID=UPI001ABF8978|nr:halocyanin domain-containing protein [Halomicrobium sp. IBSBa]MBO4246500.1 halocyanin domain-containing protein [Halomicrobium sp. IBSBa]